MTKKQALQLFEQRKVRTVWDDEQEKWYFAIVDVVAVLTDSTNPQTYWRVLKNRLTKEGNETVTNCNAFKLRAAATSFEVCMRSCPSSRRLFDNLVRKAKEKQAVLSFFAHFIVTLTFGRRYSRSAKKEMFSLFCAHLFVTLQAKYINSREKRASKVAAEYKPAC